VHGGIASRRHVNPPMRTAPICWVAVLICCAVTSSATEIAVLRNGFSIPHDHHVVMGETTRLFMSADNSSFTDVATSEIAGFEKDLTLSVPAAPRPMLASTSIQSERPKPDLDQVVNSASATYHLDPDLVNSVIHAESGFNAHAVSPKGARGLMQLMPSTASDLGVKDAFDSEANVGGGSRYLRELLERYDFDLVKALAAYNAGPQRVDRYNGVPPFYETRSYVARIVHEYNRKKIAQEKAAAEARKKQVLARSKNGAPKTPKQQRSASSTSKRQGTADSTKSTTNARAQLTPNPTSNASPR